jgi:hypothetical protein
MFRIWSWRPDFRIKALKRGILSLRVSRRQDISSESGMSSLRLERYPKYLETARFLGYEPQVSQADFDSLSESKPHAFWRKRNIDQWNPQEIAEFEGQVADLAQRFGYEHRIANLTDEARAERAAAQALGHIPQKKQGPQFWRLRRRTAGWLRGIGGRLQGMADGIDVD